jgi:glycosyltransferase involved in cell wall biosynthesis
VYNVENYLKDCLDSLINQTNGNYEIIAINDGSTDGSLSILEHYAQKDARLQVINQNNQGLSGARNTGLAHAKGEYILFVDSDDIVDTHLVESCVETLESKQADLVIFDHAKFEDGHTTKTEYKKELPETKVTALSFLQNTKDLPTSTWNPVWLYAYKRAFLDDNGLRFHIGIYHEDILFTPMALSYAKTIAILPKVLYDYRQRKGSITSDPAQLHKSLKDHLYIAEQLVDFSQTLINLDKKKAIQRIATQRYQYVVEQSQKHRTQLTEEVYKITIKSLKHHQQLLQYVSKAFYRTHLETKAQRQWRHVVESLLKWPRRIYKFKIKPFTHV